MAESVHHQLQMDKIESDLVGLREGYNILTHDIKNLEDTTEQYRSHHEECEHSASCSEEDQERSAAGENESEPNHHQFSNKERKSKNEQTS